MFGKLFSKRQETESSMPRSDGNFRTVSEEDMQRYEFQDLLFQLVFKVESDLHDEEDPMAIATRVMEAACELYEADWCGILIADLQTQVFIPEIWYEVGKGPMQETLFNDIEFTEEFATWAQHLIEQKPLIIPDVEAIRESCPMEYAAYQRLDAKSIMGVPFGQHPLGFMVIRNMKRFADRPEPLFLANFVAMMMLEQIRRARREKLTHLRDVDDGKFPIRYNILGPHNMLIDGKEIYEEDLPHPNRRAWLVMLYLVLHHQPVDQEMMIRENWPDEDEKAAKGAIRTAIFRMHDELSDYHDVKVIDARHGKLKFHDDVRITTDAEEMESLYKKSIGMSDSDEKLDILTRAYMLYRGRLFKQGEMDVDSWLVQHTMYYSQIYVDVSTELLNMLGRRKDYHRIMEYAPKILDNEPGLQTAYYWIVVASDELGNSTTREMALEKAAADLSDEENRRLLQLLRTTGHMRAADEAG